MESQRKGGTEKYSISMCVSGKLKIFMQHLLLLLFAVSFFGCLENENLNSKKVFKTKSKYSTLLSKYKDISFDTLKVFSSEKLESNQYMFKGTQLDSVDVKLFPKEFAEQYFYDHGFYACYKFSMDSIKVGLITRTPSTYEPSSIKLFILDKQRETITNYFELAETVGDAGDMMDKTSWLVKGKNNKLISFIWQQESHDNSADNNKDTTIQTWNYFYLVDFSKHKVDTLNIDQRELKLKFDILIKHQASR